MDLAQTGVIIKSTMSNPVILTGLRANNQLHIGNYFGALSSVVDMVDHRSNDFQVNLFVPDLHSFTTPIDHKSLYQQTKQNLRQFVAAGLPLDVTDLYIYRQSYVPAHSELTWILDCFTGVGEMSRMTQFKDKAADLNDDRVSVGLFNYPILMAADILLYGASYVPVGDDQSQHLEFACDIAERINRRFGELFVVPKPVKEQHDFFGNDQGLRVRDLADPTKKMSKSGESDKGVIFLVDQPELAANKVMSAATDSLGSIGFDMDERPGISNLLQLLALLSQRTLDSVISEWQGKPSYGDLKTAVAEATRQFLAAFQQRLATVDDELLEHKLVASESAMNEQANKLLLKVQQAVGLRA